MRDFLGTSISHEISESLKVLLSYDHYHKAHLTFSTILAEEKEVACPFYHCCNLEIRKNHQDVCGKKPWRIFDISSNSDSQFCWYGQGVLEYKGRTRNRPLIIVRKVNHLHLSSHTCVFSYSLKSQNG